GVIFALVPWNYPYLTAINSVLPALMAGNVVVLKHAAQTLLAAVRLQSAFDGAGFPNGVFQHLFITDAQADRLISSGLPDMVCFTGSVAGGRVVAGAAAPRFIPVGLELGGKDPAYVRPDAKLDFAVENLVDGAFFNSGQSCCAVERIYVHRDVYDAFVEGFVGLAGQYVLGNPTEPATTLGPLVRTAAAEAVRVQIQAALRAGARAHLDAKSFPADRPGTPYLAPQVLTEVNHQMAVMREESFGPVIGIMKVADDEEAIGLMNDSRYGLTASVWTEDLAAAERIGARTETGTFFVNRCDYLDPALAWTAVKDSGRGASLSGLGFAQLTRPKSFYVRKAPILADASEGAAA
ncbi:MAG: aldehyde dehydrogenase family protein, partial [Acetobacteraceae bacterium]